MLKQVCVYSFLLWTVNVLGVVENENPVKDPEEVERIEIEKIRKRYCQFVAYKGEICEDLRKERKEKNKKEKNDIESMDAGLGIEPGNRSL